MEKQENPEKLDFESVRATDLKCNKRIKLVENCDFRFEAKAEVLKREIMNTVDVWSNRNKNENIKYSNLTEDEIKGFKESNIKMDENEIIVIETDKSRKWCVNDQQQSVEDMRIHVQSDHVVNEKFVRKVTKKLHETCFFLKLNT